MRILSMLAWCAALAQAQDISKLAKAKAAVVGVRAQRMMEMRGRQIPMRIQMIGVIVGKGLVLTGPLGANAQNVRISLPGGGEALDGEVADSDERFSVIRVAGDLPAPIGFDAEWTPATGQKLVWVAMLPAVGKWAVVTREATVDAVFQTDSGVVAFSDPPWTGPVVGANALVLNGLGDPVGVITMRRAAQQGGGGRRGFRRGGGLPVIAAASSFAQYLGGEIKQRGELGVTAETLSARVAEAMELEGTRGVLVTQVTPGSAADQAGIKAQDLVTHIDHNAIENLAALQKAVGSKSAGATVTLSVVRLTSEGVSKSDIKVTLKAREKADKSQRHRARRFGFVAEPLTAAIRRSMQLPADLKGVHVRRVTAGSPAAMGRPTGLRRGDIILRAGQIPIADVETLKKALATVDVGKSVTLFVQHQADTRHVEITPE